MPELLSIYSPDYFKGHSTHTAYVDYLAEREAIQTNFRRRVAELLKFSQGGTLFEAGCAYGFFLQLAREYWSVQGIDISQEAIAYARDVLKLPVKQGDFEGNPPPANSLDVIVMWDVIEHMYDPVLAIRKSAEALHPGGFLALTTGDIDALLPRIQRSAWRLAIPAHLYYFSKASITWLLNAHGLDIVHFSYVGYYRTLHQMAQIIIWQHPDSKLRRWLVERVEKLPLQRIKIPVNLFDIMLVIAKKRA